MNEYEAIDMLPSTTMCSDLINDLFLSGFKFIDKTFPDGTKVYNISPKFDLKTLTN